MNIWVGTPASFDEDRGLAIEWQECFDESYICCLWLIFFFLEGWDFCRNFNNQWQNCLSLELKKKTPKTDLLFVDADKKNWGMHKILNDFRDDIAKG